MKLLKFKPSWRKVTFLSVATVAFAAVGLSALAYFWDQPLPSAQALTVNDRSGANKDWFKNDARFALENDGQVIGADNMTIPFYVLNSAPSASADSKPPSDMNITVNDFSTGYKGSSGSAARFTWGGGTLCSAGSAGYWNSGSHAITISKSCFTYKETINAWVVNITANLQNGSGIIEFRIHINTPNTGQELIGYSAGNGDRKFAVSNQYRCDSSGEKTGCGIFYNYTIPFGTPCTQTTSKLVSATIFDGDNKTSTSQYSIQYNKLFSVSVYDVTTGTTVSHSTSGSEGNNALATYTFTVQPGHKYQFRINNVYTNNTLQFKLPYDSIESVAQCNWSLDPSTSLNTTTSEPNSSGINVTYGVINSGNTTTKDVSWQLTRCRVPTSAPPAAYGKVGDNTQNGVNTYNALGASCSQVSAGSGGQYAASGAFIGLPGSVLSNQAISDEPVGTRICYILSVHPPTNSASDSNKWRHAKPACVTVVKKPKVQVLGGDLVVGRGSATNLAVLANVTTSTSARGGLYYGSWAEYGIVPSGVVTGMASGSGYVGGATTSDLCALSVLTFTTSSGCGAVGQYSQTSLAPNVAARFPINISAADATPSSPADPKVLPTTSVNIKTDNLSGIYQAPAGITSLTITGGNSIVKGRWVVINAPKATITITGNITYTTDALSKLSDAPQVILIAKNIIIADSVTRIDAWLVATGSGTEGRINTCGAGGVTETSALVYTQCNLRLTVNGPVMANHLILRRTAGSETGAQIGDPAEVFNFRPDAYLWATAYDFGAGRIPTAQTKELPPRF